MLDEKVDIVMTMSEVAYYWLPVITPQDLQGRRERYRFLLGTWKVAHVKKVLVNIEAVCEVPNDPVYYEEMDKIRGVNIPALKSLVPVLQERYPEYGRLQLMGEIHTHPILQRELGKHQRPWHLSSTDKGVLVDAYEQGELDSKEPFLMGVAGRIEGGKTGYAFYRLVKIDSEYFILPVDWK